VLKEKKNWKDKKRVKRENRRCLKKRKTGKKELIFRKKDEKRR